MAIVARPFAYNPSSNPTISGTTQVGDLAVGTPTSGFTNNPTFWNGPDEDLGYVIAYPVSGGTHQTPISGVTAYLGFKGTKNMTNPFSDSTFLELVNSYIPSPPGPFSSATEASIFLTDNGYWNSYPVSTPAVTSTSTPTTTPTQTNTNTPTVSPTNTPTPSTSPVALTGYSFNLVALPYSFPSSGNSIMNSAGGITSGSTDINVLATGGRGFYLNSIDSESVNRTNYYSVFTGQSVTITFYQAGITAIYSGDTDSFKYWQESPSNNGFVFGAGIGAPPTNVPSGNAVLIQSATTQFTIGVPVYVSLVINPGVTPTPSPTSTQTPTQTPTNTQTPTRTPTPTRTSTTPTPTATPTITPSATPYQTLAGSLLFDGTNQSLGLSPGVTFGAGTFTLEGWFYNNSSFSNKGIIGSPVTSPIGCMNLYFANNTTITSDRNGGGGSFSYTMASSISLNQWHYLIYNRNADGTTAVYIDGVRCTATSVDTLNYTTATDTIGRYYGGYWPGYWTNMRMTIGTAVYNSNLTTQSTPREPLTSLGNTKYLMLGAAVTTDTSTIQTVTNSNGVTQTSVKPFTPPANPPF